MSIKGKDLQFMIKGEKIYSSILFTLWSMITGIGAFIGNQVRNGGPRLPDVILFFVLIITACCVAVLRRKEFPDGNTPTEAISE